MLAPGTRLGVYEVVGPIGAGGMGEVYKAKDTRLDRIIAIKVLPTHVSSDPTLRERFEREARTIASLNHPHICTLHDVGRQEGTDFLVMEYLDGQTLAQRLTNGALPLEQALTIAIQIADALDKAHRAGIAHRDLKPGNIMLTKTGAKLLDFGLAKVTPRVVAASGLSVAPTMQSPVTMQGTILGTLQYMAPEQIESRDADARADIWAFGCVLYEMLTGKRAFAGDTQASLIGAILKDTPPAVSTLKPISASVDRIVATCLAKQPDDRWQSARDLLMALKWLADDIHHAPGDHEPTTSQWKRWVWAGLALAIATAGVSIAKIVAVRTAPPNPPVRFQVLSTTAQPILPNNSDRQIDISPDGTRLVYTFGTTTLGSELMVRRLDQLETEPFAGITSARAPFFSPDGKSIGFFDIARVQFMKVSTAGGVPTPLCGDGQAPRGASWGPDGTIVFATSDPATGLMSVSQNGGQPVVLTKPDRAKGESDHVFPSVLPSGAVLFTIVHSGGIQNAQIVALDRQTGARKTLIDGASNPRYIDTGHLLYVSADTLFGVRFDAARLQVLSDPVALLPHVAIASGAGAAEYAVSSAGTLVYLPSVESASMRSLVWVDRSGRETAINAPPRPYAGVHLSPDGNRAAVEIRTNDQDSDDWVWDFSRQTLTRVTFRPGTEKSPVWTPDGRRIVSGTSSGLFWVPADGSGKDEQLTDAGNNQFPLSFSPDGRRLVFLELNKSNDLKVLTMDKRRADPLLATEATEMGGEISPDGRWVAYESNESGSYQVYVRPFPDVTGARWEVSSNGGHKPLWARNRRELFYVDDSGALTAVPILPGTTFAAGPPVRLFQDHYFSVIQTRGYDVSPDRQHFLMIKDASSGTQSSTTMQSGIVVVLNWIDELKHLLPAN